MIKKVYDYSHPYNLYESRGAIGEKSIMVIAFHSSNECSAVMKNQANKAQLFLFP